MKQPSNDQRFEEAVLPHLDAAYNLARWLTHSAHDAEDIVQEAYLRAYRFFESYRGGDGGGRSWLLRIVHNTCRTWQRRESKGAELSSPEQIDERVADDEPGPLATLIQRIDREQVRGAIENLPEEFREVVVLRELEEMSYKEIADIVDAPIGTVMSRLSRARKRLEQLLPDHVTERGAAQ